MVKKRRFMLNTDDPVVMAAFSTPTCGTAVTDDELLKMIEKDPAFSSLSFDRDYLNKSTGPQRSSEVSKWFDRGLFRACYKIGNEFRCEFYVVSTLDRDQARIDFATKDPPFMGPKAFKTLDASTACESGAVSVASATGLAVGGSSEVVVAGAKRSSDRTPGTN
jgi:hypothetical protein